MRFGQLEDAGRGILYVSRDMLRATVSFLTLKWQL